MKNLKYAAILGCLVLNNAACYANEFVISKKTKSKKEMASAVKEDIAELLEVLLRQLASNIQQSATVQNQVIDQIKNLMNDNQMSTVQLKELRVKLEKQLKKVEEHQEFLQSIFS